MTPQYTRKLVELVEHARCSICQKSFERSTESDRRYISCPAHSFGEVVEVLKEDNEQEK